MFGQYIWLFPWRNETVKPIIVFVLADTYQSHLKFSDINTCIFSVQAILSELGGFVSIDMVR